MGGWVALIVLAVVLFVIIVGILSGIRIVRPTHRGLIERLGKYSRFAGPGIHLTIPFGIERMFQVDIRETLVDATPQTIITNDNLNARVDAQVYLKVKPDEESVKASQYNVSNYQMPDRPAGAHHAAQHHRHPDPQVGQQRAWPDQRGAAHHAPHRDRQLGPGDPPHRAQGDRPAGGRAGDDEQGRQGREREDRRPRLSPPPPRRRPTGSGAPRSRRPRASSRRRSSRPRARPRRSSWSTRRPRSTSSATPSCCASSRPWRRRSGRTPRSWSRRTATWST